MVGCSRKRGQRSTTDKKLRIPSFGEFLKRRLLAKILKGTFPCEYYRDSKAYLFYSRSLRSTSNLANNPLEVGQVAET